MTQNNKKQKKNSEEGLRINKYLSEIGLATRRKADELIKNGRVLINNKKAKLGDKVTSKDTVEIENEETKDSLVYYAYNKPKGVVTIGAQKGEQEIKDITKFPTPVFPIGRLDKDSQGLLIMTNDGRITKKLLDPKYKHEKEYVVELNKQVNHAFMVKLRDGVTLFSNGKKERTKKAKVRRLEPKKIEIVISEGKNRQIRRMCAAFNYEVKKLTRVRIMNVTLGKLKTKQWRQIKGEELKTFLKEVL